MLFTLNIFYFVSKLHLEFLNYEGSLKYQTLLSTINFLKEINNGTEQAKASLTR